jgi:hypothetical protein
MEGDRKLVDDALGIQIRRRWSRVICCELSRLAASTWTTTVRDNNWRGIRPGTRDKLKAFVATFINDSVPMPARQRRWKRGPEHHLSRLTAEQEQMIAASTKKGCELAREFGVSDSVVSRVRQKAKYGLLQ